MKKTVRDFDVNNKTVVLRCDLNVTQKDGKIIDDIRIKESLKTISYLLENNAKIVILAHLGRVKKEEDIAKNSLRLVYERLNEYLNGVVEFVPYTSDQIIVEKVSNLEFGKAILLENTRYEDLDSKKESGNDQELAKFWASLGDIFINDAFGTLHRGHASNLGISTYLETGIGFLVEKELSELAKLENPDRPFVAIMGGSKISDKVKIIEALLSKVDKLLIGGAMAYNFLKGLGYEIGDSLHEPEFVDYCKKIYEENSDKIFLTVDVRGAYEYTNDNPVETFDIESIPANFQGLDVGPKTIELFKEQLKDVKTLFWNGPIGAYELSNYTKGTIAVLEYAVNNVPTTVLGGGDIVGCAKNNGFIDKVTFASTGGGATLEYLENKDLPGLRNIKEN